MIRFFINLFSRVVLAFLWVAFPYNAAAQTEKPLNFAQIADGITEPVVGAKLRGTVIVAGTSSGPWELSFSYGENPSGTWFLIGRSETPVLGEKFADWETDTLTDGVYLLRLRVLASGTSQDYIYKVIVGNDLPIETPTPTLTEPATSTVTPTLTDTVTFTPRPTITKTSTKIKTPTKALSTRVDNSSNSQTPTLTVTNILPKQPDPASESFRTFPSPVQTIETLINPAVVSIEEINQSLVKGIFVVLIGVLIIALIFFLRRNAQ